jgi:hypothetical protein
MRFWPGDVWDLMLIFEAGPNLSTPNGCLTSEICAHVLSNAQRVQSGTQEYNFESSVADIALPDRHTLLHDHEGLFNHAGWPR